LQVLVVEDDVSIRSLVVDLLRLEGHNVYETGRGDVGVEMARAIHPDVVVMDLMLPGLDGVEATRRLKSDDATRDIRIVAMSASSAWKRRSPLLANAFLSKPFDLDRFLDLVVSD
jgi:CheY-like chemotaxis protein